MKFRVISDLHVDVNESNPFELRGDNGFVTLVAGDVSGDPELDYKWLHNNTNYSGYVIAGNHIVYNFKRKTIQDLQQMERDLFSKSDRWHFLEKDYKVFDDEKIVIFGATLWSDYEVGHASQEWNMYAASKYMNDFRLGLAYDEKGEVESLSPEWCLEQHKETLKVLDEVCKKYPDYSVVVLTHHCPGVKSIASRYSGNDCNGAYASNLDDFIVNHPNIKVWCCGHVHHTHSYDIAQCKVLANPHGYDRYYESNGWKSDTLNFELKDGIVTMQE